MVHTLRYALLCAEGRRLAEVLTGVFFARPGTTLNPINAAMVALAARKRRKAEWRKPIPLSGRPRSACRSPICRLPTAGAAQNLSWKPGWQAMFVFANTVIFDGSAQPGSPRQPWNCVLAAGRASSRTTVPAGKKALHVPEPLPDVIVQLMPAG